MGQRVAIVTDPEDVTSFETEQIDPVRWNGWACPSFSLDVAREISDWTLRMVQRDGLDGWSLVIVLDDDSVWVGEEEDGLIVFYEQAPYKDAYAIGAWGWVWEEV